MGIVAKFLEVLFIGSTSAERGKGGVGATSAHIGNVNC